MMIADQASKDALSLVTALHLRDELGIGLVLSDYRFNQKQHELVSALIAFGDLAITVCCQVEPGHPDSFLRTLGEWYVNERGGT
jgi:hypothetical protein